MELLIYLFCTHIRYGSGGYVVSSLSLSLSPQYRRSVCKCVYYSFEKRCNFSIQYTYIGIYIFAKLQDPTARGGNSVLGLWHSRRR